MSILREIIQTGFMLGMLVSLIFLCRSFRNLKRMVEGNKENIDIVTSAFGRNCVSFLAIMRDIYDNIDSVPVSTDVGKPPKETKRSRLRVKAGFRKRRWRHR